MGEWKQKGRILAVDTPLGPDELLLVKFAGKEALSKPFHFDLTMLSENHSISFEKIVGKKATVRIKLAKAGEQCFNGYVASFSQGRGGGGPKGGEPVFAFYQATLVPGFWLHTRVANLRVFTNASVIDIFEDILKKDKLEKGFQDYEIKVQKPHPKREFCIQYRETDFHFLSRLLEEEGIYYFFKHVQGNHTMVLADTPSEHQKCPNQGTAKYKISGGGWTDEDKITALEKRKEVRAGKVTLNDYDFRKPTFSLIHEEPTKKNLELDPKPAKREIYDSSGRYIADASKELQLSEGRRLAEIRMEEEEANITTITGTSECRDFTSGYRFTLVDPYRPDMDGKDFVLTEIKHEADEVEEYTVKSEGEEKPTIPYVNYFTCIPYEVPFRPPRITPKPFVQGSESATVVGPDQAKSHTDTEHYGMVMIQFHWDREKYEALFKKDPPPPTFWDTIKKRNEKSAIWVRVAYPYAGAKHGSQFTPLIGDEVIVDFLQGDPDKPVVTGSLFKGQHKSLIKPEKMIKNEILTPYGHCLHFDDKGGHITLKTGGVEVLNMADGKEDKTKFGNNIKMYTADGHSFHLAQGQNLKGIKAATKNGHTILMQKDTGVSCIQIFTEKYHSMTLDDENKIINITDTSAILSIDMDSAKSQIRITVAAEATGGGQILLEVPSGKITQKAKDIEANAAQSITLDAMTKLTLKCGASSIEMTPAEIKINSPTVKISGTAKVDVTGAMVDVNGNATTNVKGAMVNINGAMVKINC